MPYDRGQAEPAFAKLLGEQITAGNPFTLFGGFQLEDGRLDIKKHGLFPIIATARTLAIRHGIRERSTRARLDKLIALDIGGERDMKAMLAGHAMLLGLLLGQQTRDIYAGIPVSNRIEINGLAREQQVELKRLIKRLQSAPDLVRDLMFAIDGDARPSKGRKGRGLGMPACRNEVHLRAAPSSSSARASRSACARKSSCARSRFILRKLKM